MRTEIHKDKDGRLSAVIKLLAPGTELREAINRIILARTGALIVVGSLADLKPIMTGGFDLNCEFKVPRLFELAKMDGAVILSADLKTIYWANVQLMPDKSIPAVEAGTRHRTAERVALSHPNAFVIAISKKMGTVSIYVGDEHFMLESIPLVLSKADQALQTLSRYKMSLENEYAHLNMLEIEDLVTLRDVVRVVLVNEQVMRIAREVEFNCNELGRDGQLVELQHSELMAGVWHRRRHMVHDYSRVREDFEKVLEELSRLTKDELAEETPIAKALGYKTSPEIMNSLIRPRGYRMLSNVPGLPMTVINNVVERFGSLKEIMHASYALLDDVEGVGERRAHTIKDGLDRLAESIVIDSM